MTTNSAGNILYQQAAASVEEIKATMNALQKHIEKQEAEKDQRKMLFGGGGGGAGADAAVTSDPASSSTRAVAAAAAVSGSSHNGEISGSNRLAVQHEALRFSVVDARKLVITKLRSKIIDPLTKAAQQKQQQGSSSVAAVYAAAAGDSPLMLVHRETMQLVAKDIDLKEELDSDAPLQLEDDGNNNNSSRAHGNASRGMLSLRSLVPVAWCVRVAYAEAARVEIRKNKKNMAHSLSSDGSKAAMSAGGEVGGGGQQTMTVLRLLRQLPCWTQLVELGKIPRSVSEYLCEKLQDLV